MDAFLLRGCLLHHLFQGKSSVFKAKSSKIYNPSDMMNSWAVLRKYSFQSGSAYLKRDGEAPLQYFCKAV